MLFPDRPRRRRTWRHFFLIQGVEMWPWLPSGEPAAEMRYGVNHDGVRLQGIGLFEVLLGDRWPDPYLDSGRFQLVHSARGQLPPPRHVVRASGFLNLLQGVGRAVGDQPGLDTPLGIDGPKDGQSQRIE